VKNPTLETGQNIMSIGHSSVVHHGGRSGVKVAMKTGKKVIAAGPGNPPVIVDDTADIKKAAKDIVDGASFDNNVLCIAEKEVFAISEIAEPLMRHMEQNGAYRLTGSDIEKVVKTVFLQRRTANT
jgi:propionaldehyde dehydrogenase